MYQSSYEKRSCFHSTNLKIIVHQARTKNMTKSKKKYLDGIMVDLKSKLTDTKFRTRMNNAIMLNISEIRGVGYELRRNHTFVFFWPGSGVIKTRIPLICFYSTRGKHFSFHALRHIHIRYIVIFCKLR